MNPEPPTPAVPVADPLAVLARESPRPDPSPIAALTDGLVRGDEGAWHGFHAAYFDRLYHHALVVSRGDASAARDVVQQTFVRVARHARRFDREEAFWAWLATLSRNAAIDAARKRHRYAAMLLGYAREWFGNAPAAASEPERDLRAHLVDAMAGLNPDERGLIEAKYEHGKPIGEIAADAGVTAKSVESRLARIRAKLRERLLRHPSHEDRS